MPSYPAIMLGNPPRSSSSLGVVFQAKSWEYEIKQISGLVHRWKFTEASGNFVDSVGSLTLTATPTITYGVAGGPIGGSILFGASSKAVSSGLGSIPVGAAARTIILVFKLTVSTATKSTFFSYGTAALRQWFTGFLNEGGQSLTALDTFSDDLSLTTPTDAFGNATGPGTGWQMWAFLYDTTNTRTTIWQNGGVRGMKALGAAANTGSAGNFNVGLDSTGANAASNAGLTVDDISIFAGKLSQRQLSKLYNSLAISETT